MYDNYLHKYMCIIYNVAGKPFSFHFENQIYDVCFIFL